MAKISSETITAVTNATDFVSVVENYTKLEKRGSTWWGCCPFHNEKTPSFQVEPENKLFYCFGCHKGGNMLQFIMEMENLSFGQVIKELAKKAGISVIYEGGDTYKLSDEEKQKDEISLLYEKTANCFHHILTSTKQGARALNYLKNRHVSDKIIQDFKLGFAPADRQWFFKFLRKKGYGPDFLKMTGLFSKKYPKISFFSNRVMFPICTRHGKVIAFGGRTLSDDPKSPKYLNTRDMVLYKKKHSLFALNLALSEMRREKYVIFCEGYMDVLAFHQAGVSNAVAPLGTALTDEQINIVKPLVETIYLCFDSDKAGTEATLRAVIMLASQNLSCKVIQLKDGKDPAEILEKQGSEGLKKICKMAIMGAEFYLKKTMEKFDVLTSDGKTKACEFLFEYLREVKSNVKRETLINKFATSLNVSPQAVYSDFLHKTKDSARFAVQKKQEIKNDKRPPVFKKNDETRAMLAVFAAPELFKKMRSILNSDDFKDDDARALFIFLEECYREDIISQQECLSRLTDMRLNSVVSNSLLNKEFAKNTEQIIDDCIITIKAKNLMYRRDMMLNKLRVLDTMGDSNLEATDIVANIMDLERQIAELKNN